MLLNLKVLKFHFKPYDNKKKPSIFEKQIQYSVKKNGKDAITFNVSFISFQLLNLQLPVEYLLNIFFPCSGILIL